MMFIKKVLHCVVRYSESDDQQLVETTHNLQGEEHVSVNVRNSFIQCKCHEFFLLVGSK